ncbi:MAG: hypothetical protein H6642_09170 [Caldilineaceae bacterium]|nr:hypothetical protein [Caldilineaceae bacterium]
MTAEVTEVAAELPAIAKHFAKMTDSRKETFRRHKLIDRCQITADTGSSSMTALNRGVMKPTFRQVQVSA